jgi:hypothetical protein
LTEGANEARHGSYSEHASVFSRSRKNLHDQSDAHRGPHKSEIKYHQVLLAQAGFIEFEPIKSKTSERIIEAYVFNLTWMGMNFSVPLRTRPFGTN